jgi:hypothetical protein
LVDDGKRESRLDVYSTFKRMEMNRDSVGSLKSLKKFTNPLRFGSITFY